MTSQEIIRKYLFEAVNKEGFTIKDLLQKQQDGALERYCIVNKIILLEELGENVE